MVEAKTDSRGYPLTCPRNSQTALPPPHTRKTNYRPFPVFYWLFGRQVFVVAIVKLGGGGGCLRTDWPSCSCPLTQCYPLCENPSESCFSWWSFHCHNWVPGRSLLCRDWLRSACFLWASASCSCQLSPPHFYGWWHPAYWFGVSGTEWEEVFQLTQKTKTWPQISHGCTPLGKCEKYLWIYYLITV